MRFRKTAAFRIALGGVLGALAVALLLLGGTVPMAMYACPLLASLLLLPLREVCSGAVCVGWHAGVSVLALLLCPDKETALVFAFLGWYPLVRGALGRLPKLLRVLMKLALFNAAAAAILALGVWLFSIDTLIQEMTTVSVLLGVVTAVLSNVAFLLFDLLLRRITPLIHNRMNR